jgi:hypothetical protein
VKSLSLLTANTLLLTLKRLLLTFAQTSVSATKSLKKQPSCSSPQAMTLRKLNSVSTMFAEVFVNSS